MFPRSLESPFLRWPGCQVDFLTRGFAVPVSRRVCLYRGGSLRCAPLSALDGPDGLGLQSADKTDVFHSCRMRAGPTRLTYLSHFGSFWPGDPSFETTPWIQQHWEYPNRNLDSRLI